MWKPITFCVWDDWPVYATATLFEAGVRVRVFYRDHSAPQCEGWFDRRAFAPGELASDWREHVAKFVQKRVRPAGDEAVGPEAVDSAFEADWPALHEHLTLDWCEGKRRTTSTLTVFVDAGRWKGSLRDRDNGLVLFVSADSFLGVLGSLERAVVSGDGDWRDERPQGGGGKRR